MKLQYVHDMNKILLTLVNDDVQCSICQFVTFGTCHYRCHIIYRVESIIV